MDYKAVALRAIHEAGAAIVDIPVSKRAYSLKSARDILAEADLQSENIIVQAIQKHFPDHAVLSEEMGEIGTGSEFLWIIDPIDGTINYSRGLSEYCISIALEQKDEIILGMIYQPKTGELYVAEKGRGAFYNDQKMRVSPESMMINAILATDNSSHEDVRRKDLELLAVNCNKVRHVRVFGSGALHLTWLANGSMDVYFKSRFNYWDYAAGLLLIQEAGGRVTDFDGAPISRTSKNIVASNGSLHEESLAMLR